MSDEFYDVGRQALRRDGVRALDTLGLWDLLSQRRPQHAGHDAVLALFRAHGRELAGTHALGALLAQPYADEVGFAPGEVVAAVPRGARAILVGDLERRSVLLDRGEDGVTVVAPEQLTLRRIDIPGRLALAEVDARVQLRTTDLGRLALAAEILGAAEGAVQLALDHARSREQFGEPIGRFQAVRHLLALARTDCVAIEAVLDLPTLPAEVVKALAGRNGRRACERALQVLGGVGFTAELDHHHFHSRVLALDALLGTSADLTADLGSRVRESGSTPAYAAAARTVLSRG